MKNKTVKHSIQTTKESQMFDITSLIKEELQKSSIKDGIVTVFVPHTTSGVTINENADPDVVDDILLGLDIAFPDRKEFKHMEGNSQAHIKASVIGSACTIIIDEGKLQLGTWQGVYFCEFDGPRNRKLYFKFIKTN